jgi:rod shape-determining protein MreC
MVTSRDDFVIAIRSAFLRKSIKQKFSLLTLFFLSIFIIILSGLNFTPIKKTKIFINEIVYRSSFIVSIPENIIKNSYLGIIEYSSFYKDFETNKEELENLKSKEISSKIIISENNELKNLIEDYKFSTNKILAKVIVDHSSPFLRTVIINKGSSEGIEIGTNIFDKSYLVGRVIEVNYKSSRVLLLSDLNSNVPISITPGNVQAIVVGDGKNLGEIKYIKDNLIEEIKDKSTAYTSGTGSIFKSGIPVGKVSNSEDSFFINFFSDFDQLKYVFVEITEKNLNKNKQNQKNNGNSETSVSNTERIKLDILKKENRILDETNRKFLQANQLLKSQTNELNIKVTNLQNKIDIQEEKIKQDNTDKDELEFLKLNLIYSSKCTRTVFKKGYKVGTTEYKECILRRGKKIND